MAMNAQARAQAIYAQIQASNPSVGQMKGSVGSPTYLDENNKPQKSEKYALMQSLVAIFGGDLTYIQGNAEIPGAQYTAPGGASVATTGGPAAQSGTVTSPTTITGTGKIL